MFPCPCCGYKTLSEREIWDICPVCGWEDDHVQSKNPAYTGGANKESLNQAKEAWGQKSIMVSILNNDEGGLENIYKRLSIDLKFPPYFGNNLDALDECLADYVKNVCIVWNNSEQAKISLGENFDKLVEVIDFASKENPNLKLVLR